MFEIGSRVVFLQVSNPFQWVACLIELVYIVHMIHDDRLLVIATVTNPSKGFTLQSFTECMAQCSGCSSTAQYIDQTVGPKYLVHVERFNLLTTLATDSIQKRRAQTGLFSFGLNLLLKLLTD